MANNNGLEEATSHLDELLNIPRQVWLLGAGVSRDAGVPLMYDLTHRVEVLLHSGEKCFGTSETTRSAKIYDLLKAQLNDWAHVEHLLSQIGDLVSYAERRKVQSVEIQGEIVTAEELRLTHRQIQLAIRYTVEYGYLPANGQNVEKIGSPDESIVCRKSHDNFVNNLFRIRRAGLEHNPPIRFVTTNYDTLLEDALAHAYIGYVDGFSGGATGFWDPRNTDNHLKHLSTLSRNSALVCKLHGSIDWIADKSDVVMRVRSSAVDPDSNEQQLLIYPQATKYQVTQRDPFASLFTEFRSALSSQGPTLLVICGYSFGDDHINEEIERVLRIGPTSLTVLALCNQATSEDGKLKDRAGLPAAVANWLEADRYGERVIVAGSHGYYRNGLTNRVPIDALYDWWTFSGITSFLSKGAEAIL